MPSAEVDLKQLERDVVPILYPRGHVSYLPSTRVTRGYVYEDGHMTLQRVHAARPIAILSGSAETGADGQATLDVGWYLDLLAVNPPYEHWGAAITDPRPTFLAFPLTGEPVTGEPVVIAARLDTTPSEVQPHDFRDIFDGHFYEKGFKEFTVTATVVAKTLKGNPAGVDFSWLCVAETALRYRYV